MKIVNLNMLKTEIARTVLATGFIVCMVFGVFSCYCGTDSPPTLVHVSGSISDSLTRNALANALVTYGDTALHHPFVSADSSGAYKLSVREGSSILVWAGKTGYKPKTRLLGSVRQDVSGVDFKLVPDTL